MDAMMMQAMPDDMMAMADGMRMDDALLQACIDACAACEQACTVCATQMMDCSPACMNCADQCHTMMRAMLRPAGMTAPVMMAMLDACIMMCQLCMDACLEHPDSAVCTMCAASCRACMEACTALKASMTAL